MSILETNKLNGQNYNDWLRNLKIILASEKRAYVLDGTPPTALPEGSTEEEVETYNRWIEDDLQTRCYMLASMTPDLQKSNEHYPHAAQIHEHLKDLYTVNSRVVRYNTSKELFSTKMKEGTSVGDHCLKMIGLIEKLQNLDLVINNDFCVDLILASLTPSFDQFVMNYNMHGLLKDMNELMGMLVTAETSLVKEKPVMVASTSRTKGKGKGKGKKKGSSQGKKPLKAQNGIKKMKGKLKPKDSTCHHCGKKGHWKRNCSEYIASLKKGMFYIELNISLKDSNWVFDTACGSHLCNDLQVMPRSRKLLKGDMILRMGNGAKVAAEAIGDVKLELGDSSLYLNDCLYVPSLIKNIISIPVLDSEGIEFSIKDKTIYAYKNGSLKAFGTLANGLYILNSPTSILNIEHTNKRKARNLDSAQLWHARLGHISKNRMSKMIASGDLEVEDLESLPTCESCLKGKMTKRPFLGKTERTTNLLDLIHTDVCGPLRVSAQGGYSYFITFTDDHSRFGHIYLIKHKSEAFEKFKEYKSEVEK